MCFTKGERTKPDNIVPFFNWSLFSYVPKTVSDYNFLITEIDNETIHPIYYETLDMKYKKKEIKQISYYGINFNKSFSNGQGREFRKKGIDQLFLPNHGLKISFVNREFNILDRWKNKDKHNPDIFTKTKVLEKYEIN